MTVNPKNYFTQSRDHIFIAAHRGWSSAYPENTMLAFRKALTLDVDQIETDVRVSSDGELVLIHDGTVDRTTNGTGAVSEKTFAELRALDAGIKKGTEFAGERIPTLTELMELVKGHPTLTLDIELKIYPTVGQEALAFETCDRVVEMLDKYGWSDRYVLNTFSAPLHEYIHSKYGEKIKQHVYYPRSRMGDQFTLDAYTYGYCVCMFGAGAMATPEEFEEIRKTYGIRTWAGAGVKNAEGVDMAIRCGAELITCNNPDEILALLRERGKHQ